MLPPDALAGLVRETVEAHLPADFADRRCCEPLGARPHPDPRPVAERLGRHLITPWRRRSSAASALRPRPC